MNRQLVLAVLAIVVAIVALILAVALPGVTGVAGPEGPQGPAGVAGPEGPAGPNMVVAMGTAYSAGLTTPALSNLYNVTSITWNADWEQWWIEFTDIEYFVNDYVTIVRAIGDEYAGYSSQGDLLAVTLYDSTGAKTKGIGFSFVVLSAP